MEDHALRMAGTPQSARESVRIGVNDVYMDKVVKAVVALDPIAIVTSYQAYIFKTGQSAYGLVVDVFLQTGVLVPGERVDPYDGIKKGRQGSGRVSKFDSKFETAMCIELKFLDDVRQDTLKASPCRLDWQDSCWKLKMRWKVRNNGHWCSSASNP